MNTEIDKELNIITDKYKIKHLVFSGGGPAGLITYGAVKYLSKENVWSINDIKSIYGTSIGAFIGIIVSLGYEWEWLDDYIIKRPWNKVLSLTAQTILDAFEYKGLFGEKFVLESLKPLLSAKDLNEQCTLSELYDFNHIDIHIYSTNINKSRLEKVDISHKTHPDLSVIKALYMSISYPLAFRPICVGDDCFIDGGLLNNYPLNDCLEQTECDKNEVLAFKNIWSSSIEGEKVTNESSIIDYMVTLIKKMHCEICTEEKQEDIMNTVKCNVGVLGFNEWITVLSTEEARGSLIEQGEEQGKVFLLKNTNP
jgi:predicted acylesterase/phospholipase RssA